jgi:uncharacterized protein with GYD domain
MGGEMKQFYMVMGDFDFVAICDVERSRFGQAKALRDLLLSGRCVTDVTQYLILEIRP